MSKFFFVLSRMLNEQQTAASLLRAKQQTVYRSQFPKEVREKQIKEKLNHYKEELKKAVSQKSQENIKKFLQKLYETRAEQFILRMQDDNGSLIEDTSILEREMTAYYRECYELQLSFQIFLDTASHA